MMKKVSLFLNGEKPSSTLDLAQCHSIYCVDGAYKHLQEMKIIPDLIIGDFDSIKSLPENIENIHTPDQNYTDFEKALKIIIEHDFTHVDVFAANGLEQDHFLGNMSTALKYKKKLVIKFYDDRQSYYFINKKTKLTHVKGKIISLFPFPKAKKINSTGLKYPLRNLDLNMIKNIIGIRNQAVNDTVTIEFKKGNILLFIEKKLL
jgi:thiamine pyrophosphokinase